MRTSVGFSVAEKHQGISTEYLVSMGQSPQELRAGGRVQVPRTAGPLMLKGGK